MHHGASVGHSEPAKIKTVRDHEQNITYYLVVPKPGCFNWLFAIFTRKRSFALFCALLHSFALFALICVFFRWEPDTEIQYRLPGCLKNERLNLASTDSPLQRKPIQNFSIDPVSSIQTSIADNDLADPVAEAPIHKI